MKNQKGITLVALIITIIVMLILAGVSISLVVGDNGVLTQAQNLDPIQERATLKEAVGFANTEMTADYYTDTTDYKTEYQADYGIVEITNGTDAKSKLTLDLTKIFGEIEENRSSKKYGIWAVEYNPATKAETEITDGTKVEFNDGSASLTSKTFKLYLVDDVTGVNFGTKGTHRIVQDSDNPANDMFVIVDVNISVAGDSTATKDDDKPTKPITIVAK